MVKPQRKLVINQQEQLVWQTTAGESLTADDSVCIMIILPHDVLEGNFLWADI